MWVQGLDSAHKAWQQHLYLLSRPPSPQTNFTYQVSSSKNTDWQQEVKNTKNSDVQKSKDKKKKIHLSLLSFDAVCQRRSV